MPLSKRSHFAIEPFAVSAGTMKASLGPFPDHGAF
jgi:hypothetical protein